MNQTSPAAVPGALLPRPAASASRSRHKPGVALLLLDCKRLEKTVLPSAVQICRQLSQRLDILVTSPPKEPLHLLGKFLQLLESAGIDYRLTRAEGDLAEEVMRYVQRHRQISMVLIGANRNPSAELDLASRQLRDLGYPVGMLVA